MTADHLRSLLKRLGDVEEERVFGDTHGVNWRLERMRQRREYKTQKTREYRAKVAA